MFFDFEIEHIELGQHQPHWQSAQGI